jgi:transposase
LTKAGACRDYARADTAPHRIAVIDRSMRAEPLIGAASRPVRITQNDYPHDSDRSVLKNAVECRTPKLDSQGSVSVLHSGRSRTMHRSISTLNIAVMSFCIANRRPSSEASFLKMPARKQISNLPLATRRLQAAEMLLAGKPVSCVADLFGLSEVSVRKYKSLLEAGGMGAIQQLREAGPRPRMSDEARRWLVSTIKHSPKLLGFDSEAWTIDQLSIVIERHLDIRYSHSHTSRIVRDLGLTNHLLSRQHSIHT